MAVLSGVVDPLYNPRVIPRAVRRGRGLPTPVLWLDAASGGFSNQGQAGNVLDAQNGSTGGTDTNDVQVLPHGGTNYLYLPGVVTNYATAPDLAAYTPAASLDVRIAVAMDVVSGTQAFVGHYTAGGTDRSWLFMYTGTNVSLYLSTDGLTATQFTPSVSPTIVAGTVTLLQATWTASPAEVKFFQKATTEGAAANDLAVDTGWTQVGSTITASVPTVSLASSTANLVVGAQSSINQLAGRVYRTQVRVGGTTVYDANFTALTSGAATSFTESSANAATVTINRAATGRKSTVVTRPTWLFGTDDYLQVSDHPLLNFDATQDLTVVAALAQWGTPAAFARMVTKRQGGGTSVGWSLVDNNVALEGSMYVGDGAAGASAVGATLVAGVRTTTGAIVNRGSATMRAFANNTLASTSSIASQGSFVNSQPLRVGVDSAAVDSVLDAALDTALVYRRALSSGEVAALAAYLGGA
jgi:hypothetical protein